MRYPVLGPLVVSLVDNERVGIRVWMKGESYGGPTKRGARSYLLDSDWPEFRKLIDKVDKKYQEIA